MAENKKSFLLYCDLIHTVKQMPKEKAGELFMHILEYVNDLEPNTDDLIIQLTFEPIRQSLKRDLEKYERTRMKNKENAEKRWNKNNATVCDRIPPNAKNADSDNVSDSDSDSDSDNVSDKEKEINNTPSAFSFYNELLKLGAEKQLISDWLAVRKKKKLTNTQTALKGFLKQVDKSGNSLNDVLTKCIEKSWGGFEADWYKKEKRSEEKIRMF